MYYDILQHLGLSTKEVLVYEALLKLGQTSIKPLLRETGLKRGNLYDILYSLERKELCEQARVEKRAQFRPISPGSLRELAENEKARIAQAARELEAVLPKLENQFQLLSSKPYVTYYAGLEGIARVHQLILEKRKPLIIFSSFIDRKNQILRSLIEKQIKKQRALNITHKALVSKTDYVTSAEKQKEYKQTGVEIMALPNFQLPSQIVVFGDSVAISTFTTPLTTTYLENRAIAQTLSMLFEKLWQQGEKK